MTDDICGAECLDGSKCQHPVGSCPVASHSDNDDENAQGRPSEFDDDTKEAIYAAVGSGLKVSHIAAAAGVSAQTLRRWTCCIDDLGQGAVTAEDPCDFCEGYARAHAEGAREVLEECRPEFRASASFGYNETQEVSGEDGGPVEINLSETVVETGYNE
jgi:transposase-like protein